MATGDGKTVIDGQSMVVGVGDPSTTQVAKWAVMVINDFHVQCFMSGLSPCYFCKKTKFQDLPQV